MLTSILLKVENDGKCQFDTAHVSAVCAKNILLNSNGFSPFQLVLFIIQIYQIYQQSATSTGIHRKKSIH